MSALCVFKGPTRWITGASQPLSLLKSHDSWTTFPTINESFQCSHCALPSLTNSAQTNRIDICSCSRGHCQIIGCCGHTHDSGQEICTSIKPIAIVCYSSFCPPLLNADADTTISALLPCRCHPSAVRGRKPHWLVDILCNVFVNRSRNDLDNYAFAKRQPARGTPGFRANVDS